MAFQVPSILLISILLISARSKNERFGDTTGNTKRDILFDNGKHPVTLPHNRNESDRLYSDKFVPALDKNKEIYSNLSRYGRNW